MAGGCVASSVTVNENAVFAKPAALSMPQAAAALSVYVTAYYALADLARLRRGQRVLIHSAMGGVGQAAIALAKRAGAVVYATAGTAAKRDRLRELGAAAAFDSHSFGWYDELMAATGGEGVDVVLNSLAGHHIALCLQALRPGGWHCEIGKVDIYADSALGLSVFRKNLRFAAIDIDRLMHDDPDHARELTLDCLRLLADGAVPPPQVTTYGYERYAEALRFMASGQHEGKIVLLAPDEAGRRGLSVTDRRPFLDPEATYLVTGGLGGLGQHLVAYLAAAGARHLTLVDRDPAGRRDAQWLRHASGITYFMPGADVAIDIARGDVSRLEDVKRVVGGLTRPPGGRVPPGRRPRRPPARRRHPGIGGGRVRAQGGRGMELAPGDGRRATGPLRAAVVGRLRRRQRRAERVRGRQRLPRRPGRLPQGPRAARARLQHGRPG